MQSNKTIAVLAYTGSALFALYLALVATTVYFATVQTGLLAEKNAIEARIAVLESRYYDRIATIDRSDAASFGLVAPEVVHYAAAAGAPSLSFAGE